MANENIRDVVRKLEPGCKIRLIEINCEEFSPGTVYRFHNYNVEHTEAELLGYLERGEDVPPKPIIWQGNEYVAWPYELTGIEWDGTGKSPKPSLEVSNIDGSISAICLQLRNLFGAEVIEHITFEQFLPTGSDPDPTMEFTQKWYITRKSGENLGAVSFELSSPADFTGQQIPKRKVHSLCHWALNGGYRGPDCGYTDARYFNKDDQPVDNPADDFCPGLGNSCKIRFGFESPIPHGGFLGSSLIARG